MKSDLPKVLHRAAGKTLLEHVLDAAAALRAPVGVVLGRGADKVQKTLRGRALKFFRQRKRRGSGDAVVPAARWLAKRGGTVAVLCGDAPLFRPETLARLSALHRSEKNAATLLSARVADPTGYGRLRRNAAGRPVAIVEERDASPEERGIAEINSGAYIFNVRALLAGLKSLRPDNAKGEYYITDVVKFLVGRGERVGALCLPETSEVFGVNTLAELAEASRALRFRTLERLMAGGVTIVDPATTHVDTGVRVGQDTVIEPFSFLLGRTTVGKGCRVGPFSRLEDCVLADGSEIRASFAANSRIGRSAKVGPFAHLRNGTVIGPEARVGNFVEVKKSRLGRGVKASHLSYLGDATVGAAVNVGAGVITCNYDGAAKHSTVIGAGAFIGSNANLVAPLRVGAGAVVGAGSTITQNVPADALALERAPVAVKKGWAKKRRKEQARHGARRS